jgi:hypothetical protein
MAPRVIDQIDVLSPSIPLASRLSLDPALKRLGAVDGGWWSASRNASIELPRLVSSLTAQVGAVVRLGVDTRDWDDIPRRITVDGHVVRIGRFADLNHKIIATRAPQDHILLLVIPPHASTAAAKSALARAATGKHSGQPEEILAASGIENTADANPLRVVPEEDDQPREPEIRFADAETVRPMVSEAVRRDEIARWLDDGAPTPEFPAGWPN